MITIHAAVWAMSCWLHPTLVLACPLAVLCMLPRFAFELFFAEGPLDQGDVMTFSSVVAVPMCIVLLRKAGWKRFDVPLGGLLVLAAALKLPADDRDLRFAMRFAVATMAAHLVSDVSERITVISRFRARSFFAVTCGFCLGSLLFLVGPLPPPLLHVLATVLWGNHLMLLLLRQAGLFTEAQLRQHLD